MGNVVHLYFCSGIIKKKECIKNVKYALHLFIKRVIGKFKGFKAFYRKPFSEVTLYWALICGFCYTFYYLCSCVTLIFIFFSNKMWN